MYSKVAATSKPLPRRSREDAKDLDLKRRGLHGPGAATFLPPEIRKQSDQEALLPACFGIEGDDTVVVIDPYTPEVAGLDAMDEPADAVVMSSATDGFHSDAAMAPGVLSKLNLDTLPPEAFTSRYPDAAVTRVGLGGSGLAPIRRHPSSAYTS